MVGLQVPRFSWRIDSCFLTSLVPGPQDELYLIIVKQTRNCPKGKPLIKAW